MKNLKIKMFGKNSISTLMFWLVSVLLILVTIKIIIETPHFIKSKNSLLLLNISPVLNFLALLIPLFLLFHEFKKEILFTKRCIKYLYAFVVFNLLASVFDWSTNYYYFDVEYFDLFLLFLPKFLLIVFVLFLASIFNKGFQIQQENDLII